MAGWVVLYFIFRVTINVKHDSILRCDGEGFCRIKVLHVSAGTEAMPGM